MTFWEDLKNALDAIPLIGGRLGKVWQAFGMTDERWDELTSTEHSSFNITEPDTIDSMSYIGALVPNLLSTPVASITVGEGYGKMVARATNARFKQGLLDPISYLRHEMRYHNDLLPYTDYMYELGLDDKQQMIVNDLLKYYPNAPEFVRFGVREVFKPHIVAKYGYDQEFPNEIKPYMAKAGLTDEVMQWFWRAHWELPSFYNIRDMRWRGVISDVELDEWLMVNDYAPYWREKLKQIVYTPYTRVDVRRMYDTGVIGRDEVKQTYGDIGYDEIHSENLTKFTVINSDKTKDVLSTYIKAFKRGIITEIELSDQMKIMEYSDKEIELRISMSEAAVVTERPKRGLTLTNVKKLFTKGLIDGVTLEEMLINLNYSDDAVMYMKLLIISESVPHKVWTAEIKKGYRLRLVTRDETVSSLLSIGYTPEAIDLALAIIDTKLAEGA